MQRILFYSPLTTFIFCKIIIIYFRGRRLTSTNGWRSNVWTLKYFQLPDSICESKHLLGGEGQTSQFSHKYVKSPHPPPSDPVSRSYSSGEGVWKQLNIPGAFSPGGFPTTMCQFTLNLFVYLSMPMHVHACATKEKEHWGQLYLCCVVAASWQCPSHHSMGPDVGFDRSDLCATSTSPDTQTHAYAYTHTRTRAANPDRQSYTRTW